MRRGPSAGQSRKRSGKEDNSYMGRLLTIW